MGSFVSRQHSTAGLNQRETNCVTEKGEQECEQKNSDIQADGLPGKE